jgi:spore maturation protein CgeB
MDAVLDADDGLASSLSGRYEEGELSSTQGRKKESAMPLIESGSPVKAALGYPKFAREKLVCVILGDGYHLQRECARAMRDAGHEVVMVPLEDKASAMIGRVVRALLTLKPDFVLSVNHLGFDSDNALGEILEECEMPTAVWYCDNPMIVLEGGRIPAATMTTCFTWERKYIPWLRSQGVEDLHYLPLGTDFVQRSRRVGPLKHELCFVGDSMQAPASKYFARLSEEERAQARTLAAQLRGHREYILDPLRELDVQRREGEGCWDIVAAACWEGTAGYRRGLLEGLEQDRLSVFGDEHWRDLLPGATWGHRVSYGQDLAEIYGNSAVNINATSFQMTTAVNQRVFDVPAAGGFLLTDNQEDVAQHFELSREVMVYRSPEELADLAGYYLKHERERKQIVARARARIEREHRYFHRVERLLSVMRARYAH